MGIPVQVNPFFWLIGVFFGINLPPKLLILWLLVLFVSILVHEMGHALTMRRFGFQPRVVLYSFGGLAIPDSGYSSYGGPRVGPRERILYTIAGPAAGFFVAGIVMIIVLAVGGHVSINLSSFPVFWDASLAGVGEKLRPNQYVPQFVIDQMLWVNIFWGLMNLLPVFPLDGGQIAREILTVKDPWKGNQQALWLSTYVGGGVAVFAIVSGQHFYMALMFGMLAYSSYQMLQRGGFR